MSIRVINPIYFYSESVTSLISNIFPLTEMSNFYWQTSEAWKFWSFGKKRRMELDLKCGGCGKTVTFSIFKICFTSRNVCDEALSQGRRTCLDFSFIFLLLIGAYTRTCISAADNTSMGVMFISLFESNAFKISYNTHYIIEQPQHYKDHLGQLLACNAFYSLSL